MENFDKIMKALEKTRAVNEEIEAMSTEQTDAMSTFLRENIRIADKYKQPRRVILITSLHTFIDSLEGVNWDTFDPETGSWTEASDTTK